MTGMARQHSSRAATRRPSAVCAGLGAVLALGLALPSIVDAATAPGTQQAAAGSASDAPSPPATRIVSTNVCTDQLLMSLVPVDRIASVSFLAADPQVSLYAEQA